MKWDMDMIAAANTKLSSRENSHASAKQAKACQYRKGLLKPMVFFCFASLSVWKK
jgi:hypothetical protein